MPPPGKDSNDSFFRYLTSSEEDEKWQLVITDAGHNEIGPGIAYPPHKSGHPVPFKSVAVGRTLSEYQIIYITRGQGSFATGGRDYMVEPGSIMLLFPGVSHVYKPDFKVGWNEYWVGFKGPYADHLHKVGFLTPERPFFEIGLQDSILSSFTTVLDLVREQAPLYQIRASSVVLGLIAEILARARMAQQFSHSERLVQRAKFLMEENIYGELNLGGICEELGVSQSQLNEAFKAYTAMTPYRYFISIKIHKAKELLERMDAPIKEVASRLGFKDEYYFSRLFKSKAGVSPSRWRTSGQ
jgi:AraC-like DNA-binding protein